MVVEFTTDEFQFYKDGKPTGHYARGKILIDYGDKVLVKCFSNGLNYIVNKEDIKHVIL